MNRRSFVQSVAALCAGALGLKVALPKTCAPGLDGAGRCRWQWDPAKQQWHTGPAFRVWENGYWEFDGYLPYNGNSPGMEDVGSSSGWLYGPHGDGVGSTLPPLNREIWGLCDPRTGRVTGVRQYLGHGKSRDWSLAEIGDNVELWRRFIA